MDPEHYQMKSEEGRVHNRPYASVTLTESTKKANLPLAAKQGSEVKNYSYLNKPNFELKMSAGAR